MISLITLVATLIISLLVTRIGAVALALTGMSQDSARFQARSAYTGVGFTTSESEQVVNHPVRRRVLMALMMTGNIGIAVVIASMMSAFAVTEAKDGSFAVRLLVLSGSLLLLWVIGTQKFVDQTIEKIIEWSLRKWTHLDVRDYTSLLHLADGYVVFELRINEEDWIAEKSLSEAILSAEGVLVLGIHRRNGNYVGSPYGETTVHVGDVLTVYGQHQRLEELDIRKRGYEGDRAHKEAIKKQKQVEEITIVKDKEIAIDSPRPDAGSNAPQDD